MAHFAKEWKEKSFTPVYLFSLQRNFVRRVIIMAKFSAKILLLFHPSKEVSNLKRTLGIIQIL
jgi:hypothetical protein